MPLQNLTINTTFSIDFRRDFECLVDEGFPIPDVYWTNYKFDRISGPMLNVTNKLLSLDPQNNKQFHCFAENNLGKDMRTISIILSFEEGQFENNLADIEAMLSQGGNLSNQASQETSDALGVLASTAPSVESLMNVSEIFNSVLEMTLNNNEVLDDSTATSLLNAAGTILDKSAEYEEIGAPSTNSVVSCRRPAKIGAHFTKINN